MSNVEPGLELAGTGGRDVPDRTPASVGQIPPVKRAARVRRMEFSALQGVLIREIVNFSSYWRGTSFSSVMEPTIYLLAFGFGFGSLVARVDGFDYVDFVGTGTVATAVLFSAAFPAMFGTFVKATFQHTYDAILAAPVDTEELVTAEALWIATRAGTFGCVPMLVAILFGLDPRIEMLAVPLIAFLAGFGWACFGIMIAGFMKGIENFSYVTSGVLTPLMLTAGTFFPLTKLPHAVQVLGYFNPLHHCVELVRHAAFGWQLSGDLAHVGALVLFGVLTWRLAVIAITRKLIT